MSWNIDIAKDELNRLNVADDFKDFLVSKAHEFFGVEADVAADPESDADTSGASPEGNEGASDAATSEPETE